MKEIDGWVKIKKYTDDYGRAICGKCKLDFDTYDCEYSVAGNGPEYFLLPGQSCPVWHGESKSSIAAIIEEIAKNKEVIVSANPTPQIDADEPRYAVHITGPERLLVRLADLFFTPQQREKLKRCPFCGSPANKSKGSYFDNGAYCSNIKWCRIGGIIFHSEEEWNTRAGSKLDDEVISRMQTMCEESLDPERFDAWEDIKHQLFSNRSNLTSQEK